MNLLPIAAPAAPASGPATENAATAASGDFAALVAMLVATAATTLPAQRPPAHSDTPLPAPADAVPSGPDSPVAEPFGAAAVPGPASAAPTAMVSLAVTALPAAAGPPPADPLLGPAERATDVERPATPVTSRAPAKTISVMSEPQMPPPAETVPPPARPGAPIETDAPSPPGAPIETDVPASSGTPIETAPVVDAPRVEAPAPAEPKRQHHDVSGHEPRTIPAPQAQVATVPADRQERRTDMSLPEEAEGRPAPKITATVSPSSGSPNPTVPLIAVNRSEALNPVDVPPAAPVAQPDVSEQIVSAVVPLHGRGDGRHEVTLELRPDHLGTIRVEVTVEQQTVHLALHATEPETNRLLAAALPELRTSLADAGLTAGHLEVGSDSAGTAGQWRNPSRTGENHDSAAAAGRGGSGSDLPEPARLPRPAAAGRLDLLL